MEKTTAKAKEYSAIKVRLTVISCVFTVLVMSALIYFGWSRDFAGIAENFSANPFLIVGLYFILFSAYLFVLAFPLSYYASFMVEHRFGLSNQTFMAWLREGIKKEILSIAFGMLLVEGLYFFIRLEPTLWWLYAWGFLFLVKIILGHLFPVLIVPLFYKYSAIADQSLHDRILAFVSKHGPKVKGIFSLNLSKTTKKANAAFCGLGSTKRVILSDTLLEKFTPDEIEMVMAHEIGHFKMKHLLKGIIFESALLLVGFYVLYVALHGLSNHFGFHGQDDVAAFPVMYLIFFVCGLTFLPIQNSFSRRMEHAADDFAVKTATVREAFSSTMNKLADINLADRDPHPVIEFFLYSHPSISRRLKRQAGGGSLREKDQL
jgi:STE24 endopeptidase